MPEVKIPLLKRFSRKKVKLKGLLTQIKLKIRYKEAKLPVVIDQVMYAGLFLIGQILKWFKLYSMEYKANGLATANAKVRYIFLSYKGFCNKFI